MSQNVAFSQTSFNAGEVSPYLEGRVDLAKYGNGCFRMVNFKPVPQGPAVRRMGTRFVAPTKTQTHRSWLHRFIFSEDDSYILEFGHQYLRFYADNGQVLNLGLPYEIVTPYNVGDLTDAADGTCRMSFVQTGDVVFICVPGYYPQKLTRLGHTNWTIANADIKNGPFEDVNPDETTTVYASATTGAVTLTASTAIFTADMVGTLFLLEQKSQDAVKAWEPGKVVVVNDERRSDSNVYRALTAGTTGTIKPVHREGAKVDGDPGVQWQYLHSGYGYVLISAVGGLTATGTVIGNELPFMAVGVANASNRWAKAAWRSTTGFPTLTTIFRERLCFARGQQLWGSVAGDYENFASRDGAETLPDSAFSITFGTGESNAAVWMVPQDSLLIGTRGAEFAISEITSSEPFGPGNIKASQDSAYGSRQVPPAIVGGSTLFAQRSGNRVRDMRFSFNVNKYEAADLMVLSDQVVEGQIIQMAFALEPSSTVWCCCANGDFVGLAYQLEQDVVGWHPQRIGGGSGEKGVVESIMTIPAPNGDHDQVWMQVFRVIDGQATRYVEYLERDWRFNQQALEDAVYSDACATFNGFVPGATAKVNTSGGWTPGTTGTVDVTGMVLVVGDIGDQLVLFDSNVPSLSAKVQIDSIITPTQASVTFVTNIPPSLQGIVSTNVSFARDVISGLDYLEGEEVTLTVNGAAHPRVTVVGGSITLQSPASKVQVGLPADAELITMRIEGGAINGTAQGKIKRVHQVTFRLHESLGGNAGPEGGEVQFDFRSALMPMDQPPPVMTGDYRLAYNEGYNTLARIRVTCNQPLPFTLVALYPQASVEDRL